MTSPATPCCKSTLAADIVDRRYDRVCRSHPASQNRRGRCPPARFEMPLRHRTLAKPASMHAIICAAAFGLMRHLPSYFVAAAVVDGLNCAWALDRACLCDPCPDAHHLSGNRPHNAIYRAHFVEKGREVSFGALGLLAGGNCSTLIPLYCAAERRPAAPDSGNGPEASSTLASMCFGVHTATA